MGKAARKLAGCLSRSWIHPGILSLMRACAYRSSTSTIVAKSPLCRIARPDVAVGKSLTTQGCPTGQQPAARTNRLIHSLHAEVLVVHATSWFCY